MGKTIRESVGEEGSCHASSAIIRASCPASCSPAPTNPQPMATTVSSTALEVAELGPIEGRVGRPVRLRNRPGRGSRRRRRARLATRVPDRRCSRTTITSLWKVDDDATRKLMERYYDNYWKKNMGTLESLREAQLWMLQEGAKRGIVRVEDPNVNPPVTAVLLGRVCPVRRLALTTELLGVGQVGWLVSTVSWRRNCKRT